MRRRSTIWASSGRGFNKHPRAGWTWWKQEWPCPGSFKRSDRLFSYQAWRDLYRRHGGPGRAQFRNRKTPRRTGTFDWLDKDPAALDEARVRLISSGGEGWPEVSLLHGSFAEIGERFEAASADGLLADLGVSSLQLDTPSRGFSFQAEGALDMRMNPQAEPTAEQVVNQVDEVTLANLIYEFGEERRSRRIARAIVRSRPIRTTAELAAVVSAAARPMNQPQNKHERRIHPATRTFQALRIFVNHELDDLRELLNAAPRVLKPGGRIVIISFHSLEDRIVKDAFREGAKQGHYKVLTKKPVTAGEEEMDRNPRSRSAKMRAAERV